MSRKPPPRPIVTNQWVLWAICRKLCQWLPGLSRTFNFPLKISFAGDFATSVLEDEAKELALAPEQLEQVRGVLVSAMANDGGDTSTYPKGASKLRSLLFKIDHCVVTGHTMWVLDKKGVSILDQYNGATNSTQAPPTLLKQRMAPSGTFYTLTCNGHFGRFFENDVLPLLYFLRKHGPETGPLHIVTRRDFPLFIEQTLRAICSTYTHVQILDLDKTERLVDVSALWISRRVAANAWMPVTPDEAHDLAHLLSRHHQLPAAAPPHRLLFVSRGDSRLRRLVNEAELMAELMDFDFDLFFPKSDDHKSQIEAFRSARIVISVHGAGLTNLLFCQPGTLVIELLPSNHIKSAYCWLAMRLGLRYRAVICFSGDDQEAFAAKIPLVVAELEAELGSPYESSQPSPEDPQTSES